MHLFCIIKGLQTSASGNGSLDLSEAHSELSPRQLENESAHLHKIIDAIPTLTAISCEVSSGQGPCNNEAGSVSP